RRFRLDDLDPHVGVREVGQATCPVPNDVADVGLDAVDELDADAGADVTHRRRAPPSPPHQSPRLPGLPPARSDSFRSPSTTRCPTPATRSPLTPIRRRSA